MRKGRAFKRAESAESAGEGLDYQSANPKPGVAVWRRHSGERRASPRAQMTAPHSPTAPMASDGRIAARSRIYCSEERGVRTFVNLPLSSVCEAVRTASKRWVKGSTPGSARGARSASGSEKVTPEHIVDLGRTRTRTTAPALRKERRALPLGKCGGIMSGYQAS